MFPLTYPELLLADTFQIYYISTGPRIYHTKAPAHEVSRCEHALTCPIAQGRPRSGARCHRHASMVSGRAPVCVLHSTVLHVAVVQSLSHLRLYATSSTAACQASLSFATSWNLLKLTSTDSVMPSKHLVLCHSLLLLPSIFPSMMVFSKELAQCHVRMAEWSKAPDSRFYLPKSWLFASGGQSIRASASVFPMNIKG